MKLISIFRKFIPVVMMGLCFSLNAQTVSHNFKTTINDVFAGVDLTRVPHHLLTDYAMEYVDIRSYNGVANDTNYVHKGIYTSAYYTLLMARTQTNVPDLAHPDQFNNNWEAARTPYNIALSGLYYRYSRIRENAYPNAITVNNNKLYDKYVNGVWQNPYETDDVFMMTAPILKYNYKNMQVTLPADLWYTNQDAKVQSIAVNFNDGNGYQTIGLGQTVNVSYRKAGTYDWDYKLTLTNNQVLYSHSKLIVGDGIAPIGGPLKRLPSEPCTIGTLVNGFDQVEFQGTQQFDGVANSATIQIDYASGNPCDDIENPLIVAEGFESGLLGNENPLGDNDILNFIDEATDDTGQLSVELANYDIIYINWDQGRDDLRRNALLLQDIIEWVNETKTTNNKNVVLGQSMGGVIARYALADMEANNLNHDTSLYISHDAPHQGANIPISVQYLARHLADQFVSTPVGDMDLPAAGGGSITISDIQNVFNSLGTKQLLANNINGSFQLDNSTFVNWQADLQAKGYPQQTRNIAISNGSHCANTQEVHPQEELLFLSGEVEPTIFLDTIINYVPFLAPLEGLGYIALAIILEDPAYLAGLLPGRTNFNARFEAKTLPSAGQSANIYKGRLRITKKINFLIGSLTYNINITNREYNNPNAVQLPLDSYPGGAYPVPFDLSEINESENNNWLYNLNLTGRSANSFGFIPTPTALDVGGGNATLNNNDYLQKYNAANPPTGSKAIPFDNFTTSFNNGGTNEMHISFNTRNGDWLATELDAIVGNEEVFDCSYICVSTRENISGSSQVCSNSSENYTINSWPTNANITWSVNPSGAASNIVSNGNSVTITSSGNLNGWATLQASISTDCGSKTVEKNIYMGAKRPQMLDLYGNEIVHIEACTSIHEQLYFTLPDNEYSNQWEWRKISGNFTLQSSLNHGTIIGFQETFGIIDVRAFDNECGWSPRTMITVNITNCSGDFEPLYTTYPNPATDILTIGENSTGQNYSNLTTQSSNLDSNGTEELQSSSTLYDFNGNPVSTISPATGTINIESLPAGHYILIISYGNETESHHVIIN